ncbi:hypothetical protein MUO79_00820 [Candidatus Bathyarchaeota archaeon]|nr:hypothetical protein [Candidatus Bathyarchaeota archaeon]
MTKRLSSDKFLECFDAMWQRGPFVKYQNPDAWIKTVYLKAFQRVYC